MAGFRDFQTGEVLTAANVNDFLAKQAVMKFADAAARDTALGTATGGSNALREGMVAYLDDTDEVISYDGTSWATVGNAGIGSNVQVAAVTSDFSTTNSSPQDVTGATVTITLSSATSRLLVLATGRFIRNSTAGSVSSLAINVAGSQVAETNHEAAQNNSVQSYAVHSVTTPGSVGPHTVKLQLSSPSGGTATVSGDAAEPIFLTAIEVAA